MTGYRKKRRITTHRAMVATAVGAAFLLPAPAFAMHISEGILPFPWAALWYAIALPFVAWGLRDLRRRSENAPSFKPFVGLVGAAVFLISCMPIPVPTAGTCAHAAGTGLAAILIGPGLTVVVASIALTLQALFLAHGGLTTLGANIVSMGVAGAYAGYGIYTIGRRLGIPWAVAAFLAGLFSDWATYAMTSVELAAALHRSGSFSAMLSLILLAFVPTQIPLGIVEGFLCAGALGFVRSRKPELLRRAAAGGASLTKAALPLILAGALLVQAPPPIGAASWPGVDEAVIERVAEKAGRPAREPLINTDQGDLLLFVFLVAGIAGGFVAGYNFRTLFPPKRRTRGRTTGLHISGNRPDKRGWIMFDLFSDIFTYRDNVLTRIDPRAKLLIAFAALVVVVTAGRVTLPLLLFGLCLGAIAALRIPAKLVAVRLAAPLAIVAILVVLQAFVTGTTPIYTFTLAGSHLTAKAEGLRQGTLLGARVLGAVSVVFLLSLVTPAHRIFQALRWFGISRNWLEIAILMYRYIFVLMDRVANIAAAQKLRLGYTTRGRALRSFTTLAGATIIHSFEQAERTNDAMRLRGYRGTMPFGPLPAIGGKDRLILALSLVLIAAARLLEWGVAG